MLQPHIKNLIFDFGNVLIDIDFERTFTRFKQLLGEAQYAEVFPKLYESDFYQNMERAKYTAEEMTAALNGLGANLTVAETSSAWNALLLELPNQRIELLKQLSKQYRLFMLSNTNYVHITEIWRQLEAKYGHNPLFKVFDKLYLSYEIGFIKPEPEIYTHLLADAGIKPQESIFFDDLQKNLDAASKLGIHTQLVTKEIGVMELLANQ